MAYSKHIIKQFTASWSGSVDLYLDIPIAFNGTTWSDACFEAEYLAFGYCASGCGASASCVMNAQRIFFYTTGVYLNWPGTAPVSNADSSLPNAYLVLSPNTSPFRIFQPSYNYTVTNFTQICTITVHK